MYSKNVFLQTLATLACLCPQLWNAPLCLILITDALAAREETTHSTQPVDLNASQAS